MNDLPPKKKTPTKRAKKRAKTPKDLQTPKALSVIQAVQSGMSTRQALQANGVSNTLYYSLLAESEDLKEQYTRAKEGQALHYADKLLEIAQDVLDGNLDPQAARAAADIIKWTAARILPNTYSERKQVDVNLNDGSKDPAAHLLARARALSDVEVIDVS